jgi:hypothetical protein
LEKLDGIGMTIENQLQPKVWNIPPSLNAHYVEQPVVLRFHDLADLSEAYNQIQSDLVFGIELLSLRHDPVPLLNLPKSTRITLVLASIQDYALLYNFAQLLRRHPTRVVIPLEKGFSNAVKLAFSLNMAVKLEATEPTMESLADLQSLIEYYLHQQTITQPMEFIHSVLMGFFHNDPVSLWKIQEEDPLEFGYVDEDGREHISARLKNRVFPEIIMNCFENSHSDLSSEFPVCARCEFLAPCACYFKFPDQSYDCRGIKRIFSFLLDTASQLRSAYETTNKVR